MLHLFSVIGIFYDFPVRDVAVFDEASEISYIAVISLNGVIDMSEFCERETLRIIQETESYFRIVDFSGHTIKSSLNQISVVK